MTKRKIRRFLYISRADTPLRRLFDRACGLLVLMSAIVGAVWAFFWWVDNRLIPWFSNAIDWCGYHPFVPSIAIALMIGVCVVIDCRCGKC